MDANAPTGETMSEGSSAGDELAAPPQVGASSDNTVTVPMDMLPGCKVGDTYTVKSIDGGNVMLEPAMQDSGDSWGNDATAAMKGAE